MIMNRRLSATLAAALLSGLCISHANAASGLYIGAGVGDTTIKENTGSGTLDSTDTSYKAFVGYRFNMIPIIDLAVEGGYIDFGKPSQTFSGQNVQFKLHGADAAALLIFPLGPFDLYGKAGMLSWSGDSTVAGTTTTKTGTDPFYGVGVGFYLWKIGIRAEYEQYKIKDVDQVYMYSVSALFQF
jgi:outer membrane immunogenic protein